MRKFIVFAAACLFACSFLLMAQPASAALGTASTAWTQFTDQNSFTLNYSGGLTEFGIFNSEDPDDYLEIDGFFAIMRIDENHNVFINDIDTGFSLSASETFGFYLGDWDSRDTDYEISGILNKWDLDFNGDNISDISVGNANPVPIPTALFLFGSGLVGLAGFRRKTKK